MNEIKISNIQPQEIIIGEGGATGITTVYVNGVDVTEGSVAYVVVPTKLSELQNDEHFITQETDPTVPYYIKTITLSDINSWNNKQDRLVSGSNIKTINNQSILGNGNINVSTEYTAGTGINITSENVINNTITSYNDLNDLPTIPSKTSELLNDSDFVTSDELSNVAFSGSYADLSDTPDLSVYATLDTEELLNYYTKEYLFGLLPKVSDTGTNITLNNTYSSSLKLNLGATELSQDGTPTPSSPQDIHTISGSNTIKVEGSNLFDGIMELGIINGITGNNSTNANYIRCKNFIPVEELTNYKITSPDSTTPILIYEYKEDFTYNLSNNKAIQQSEILTTNAGTKYIRFRPNNGTTDTSLRFMVNKGSTALPYTPYTLQEADIDLDTLEYCKIGNYEDKFIRTSGKNLFDETNMYNGYYDTTDGSLTSNNAYRTMIIDNLPAGTYTFSTTLANAYLLRYWVDNTSTFISTATSTYTFTSTTNGKVMLCFRNTSTSTITETFNTMLNKGSTALDYEPYGSNEWYIKKNIGNVVLDGTETWTYNAGSTLNNCNSYTTPITNSKTTTNTSNELLVLSNYFKGESANTSVGNWLINTISLISTNRFYLSLNRTDYPDNTSVSNLMSNIKPTFYYVVETPTYTQITGTLETQLENVYKNMLSQEGQTNISQENADLPFTITATTLKDISNL